MSMVSAMDIMTSPVEIEQSRDHHDHPGNGNGNGNGNGSVNGNTTGNGNAHYTAKATVKSQSRPEYLRAKTEVDAADGWRGEKVLYQCACVATL